MLDIQYTEDGLKDLNYVIIDAKPKEGHDPNAKGLFLGIKTLSRGEDTGSDDETKGELFIWIYNAKTVLILNLKHYFINCIETSTLNRTQSVHFRKNEASACLAKLHTVQAVLISQKKIKPNGLVDLSAYKSLPTDFTEITSKTTETDKDISGVSSGIKTSFSDQNWPNNKSATVAYKSKEVETSIIRRTTKCPAEEALTIMKAKIGAVKGGTYKPPKLKRIPADHKKKDKEEDNKEGVDKQTASPSEDEYAYPPGDGFYG